MEKLQKLYEELVNLSDITDDSVSGVREYKLEVGSAFASALKHNSEVAVAQSWMSAGAIFPYHNHEKSQEILVVYSGEVTVVTDNEKVRLRPGDSLHICKGCGHMLLAKTDVKLIAITIPPDAVAIPKMNENGR